MPQFRHSLPAALLALCGVGGFVGLLVASTYYPRAAFWLRALAILWFLVIGVIKFIIDLRGAEPSEPFEAARRRRLGL